MPVRKPKKPVRNGGANRARVQPVNKGGSRRARATLPENIIEATGKAAHGVGSRFMEAATREPDLGHGLPKATRPVIATTPTEIRNRAAHKREANRRRTAANNVRGYAQPLITGNDPRQMGGALPTAEELFELTEGGSQPLTSLPSAEELLNLTSEQEYDVAAHDEGTYHFPQVAPTKTAFPVRPRTLEAGWERITDTNDPRYPGVLRVRFRDGTPWEYYNIPANLWQRFKRVQSPGRFINRVLDNYPYARGEF